MFKITLHNSGGPIDERTADTEESARDAAIAMLQAVPMLCDGDRVTVAEVDQ